MVTLPRAVFTTTINGEAFMNLDLWSPPVTFATYKYSDLFNILSKCVEARA